MIRFHYLFVLIVAQAGGYAYFSLFSTTALCTIHKYRHSVFRSCGIVTYVYWLFVAPNDLWNPNLSNGIGGIFNDFICSTNIKWKTGKNVKLERSKFEVPTHLLLPLCARASAYIVLTTLFSHEYLRDWCLKVWYLPTFNSHDTITVLYDVEDTVILHDIWCISVLMN